MRVSQYILGRRYTYFINKVKTPLRKSLIKLTSDSVSWIGAVVAVIQVIRLIRKYPNPTKETTPPGNTHVLIDLWDKFFECQDESQRDQVILFTALRRLHLATYAHDSHYAERNDRFLEWWLEKYENGEWQCLPAYLPRDRWKEPCRLEAWDKMAQEETERADWLAEIRKKFLGDNYGVDNEESA